MALYKNIYPVKSAQLQCSKGSGFAYLSTPKQHASIGQKNFALQTDASKHYISGDFGICTATCLKLYTN